MQEKTLASLLPSLSLPALSAFDLAPLLKDPRTAGSLLHFANLVPQAKAELLHRKVAAIRKDPKHYDQLRELGQRKAKLQERLKAARDKYKKAQQKKEASQQLLETKRREREKAKRAHREYIGGRAALVQAGLYYKSMKDQLFALVIRIQKQIPRTSLLSSPEQYKALSDATKFKCDVLATSQLGQLPSTLPALEIPAELMKHNSNQLMVHLTQDVFRSVQQILRLQASRGLLSTEARREALAATEKEIHESRLENKAKFLENQKALKLLKKDMRPEAQRLVYFRNLYKKMLEEWESRPVQKKEEVDQEQEAQSRLRCLQHLFSIFLRHKKRVDGFVSKKVGVLGDEVRKESALMGERAAREGELLSAVGRGRAEQAFGSFVSEARFTTWDARAGEVLALAGWRSYQPVSSLLRQFELKK